jgi:hypothetical protein
MNSTKPGLANKVLHWGLSYRYSGRCRLKDVLEIHGDIIRFFISQICRVVIELESQL